MSAAETLQIARERGSEQDTAIIDGNPVHKKLQPQVEKEYEREINLWFEYQRQHPEASPYQLIWLKRFVRAWALAMNPRGGEELCGESVRKRWNRFTAKWARLHPKAPIPEDTRESITQFIKGDLTIELGMVTSKRRRAFATARTLYHLARQIFAADWFVYQSPATRLDDWCIRLNNILSSSRIGEYLLSSCRSGTNQGLLYKDVIFVIFRNESGDAEFSLQLTRYAKNMTHTPYERPQHSLYEIDDEPRLLCFNPMLFNLARLLAQHAFRDYITYEDLMAIEPPEDGELMPLPWKDELLETPFFINESTGKIETANSYSNRDRDACRRAGYPDGIRNHDFRREGLHQISHFVPEPVRQRYAGHTNSNIQAKHYTHTNAADGQAAFFGKPGRKHVLDLFRTFSVPRNPSLWQCLPAKKQYELENSQEFLELEEKLNALESNVNNKAADYREKLLKKRRELKDRALRTAQKQQPIENNGPPGYHRSLFGRVRFEMPLKGPPRHQPRQSRSVKKSNGSCLPS